MHSHTFIGTCPLFTEFKIPNTEFFANQDTSKWTNVRYCKNQVFL